MVTVCDVSILRMVLLCECTIVDSTVLFDIYSQLGQVQAAFEIFCVLMYVQNLCSSMALMDECLWQHCAFSFLPD